EDELPRRRLEGGVVGEDDELVAVGADPELGEGLSHLGQPPAERLEVLAHALHGEPGVEQRHRGLEREKILKIVVKAALLPDGGADEAGLRPVAEPRLGEPEDLRGVDERPDRLAAHESNPSTSMSTCTRAPSVRTRTSASRRAKRAPARSAAAAAA